MSRIAQDPRLLTAWKERVTFFRPVFRQQRVFHWVVALRVGEGLTLGRHTVTRLLMTLGWVDRDGSAWYRVFRKKRFPYARLAFRFLEAVLEPGPEDQVLVVAGDGTTTPRSSAKMEGVSGLPDPKSAPFQRGLRLLQRGCPLAGLTPPEEGDTRALPLLFLPAFTPKAVREKHPMRSEGWAAQVALRALRWALKLLGRGRQRILFVGDGHDDHQNLWKRLPEGVILRVRTARNRVLSFLPEAGMRPNRKDGRPAPRPAQVWRERKGWRHKRIQVRGRLRHLQGKVMDASPASGRAALLGLAAVGGGGGPSGEEARFWAGRETAVASGGGRVGGAVGGLGLWGDGAGGVSSLGGHGRAPATHPVVARWGPMVLHHPVADRPGLRVGRGGFPGQHPGTLADLGGLGRFVARFGPGGPGRRPLVAFVWA